MTGFAIPHRSPSGPFVEPTRRDRLDARLHAMALDRQLAAGVAPWTSPRHAARALQLTGRRERRALARGLNRSLQEARGAGLNGRLVAILIPCRSSVLACAGLLEQLSATLSGSAPLDVRSVARLRLILSDFDSALYVHGHAAQLHEQVTQIGAQIAVDS